MFSLRLRLNQSTSDFLLLLRRDLNSIYGTVLNAADIVSACEPDHMFANEKRR